MFQGIWTRIVQCIIKIPRRIIGSLIYLWIIKNLMTDPKGNNEVFFSKNLNNEVEGKQNSLFPVGPFIECFVIPPNQKREKTGKKLFA